MHAASTMPVPGLQRVATSRTADYDIELEGLDPNLLMLQVPIGDKDYFTIYLASVFQYQTTAVDKVMKGFNTASKLCCSRV